MGRSKEHRKRGKRSVALKKAWALKKQRQAVLMQQNIVQNELATKEDLLDVRIKVEIDIEETKIAGLVGTEEPNEFFLFQTKIKEEDAEFDCDPLREVECDILRRQECDPLRREECKPVMLNGPTLINSSQAWDYNSCKSKLKKSSAHFPMFPESKQKFKKIKSTINWTGGETEHEEYIPAKLNGQSHFTRFSKRKNFRVYGSATFGPEQRKKLFEKSQLQLDSMKTEHKQQLEAMEQEKELIELKLLKLKKLHELQMSLLIKRHQKLQDN